MFDPVAAEALRVHFEMLGFVDPVQNNIFFFRPAARQAKFAVHFLCKILHLLAHVSIIFFIMATGSRWIDDQVKFL